MQLNSNEVRLHVPEYHTVPDITQLVMRLSDNEKNKLLNLEREILRKIIGQDVAVAKICRAIRRNKVGFKDPKRPVGSFILLGMSGTGKTELCKALAETLYGSEKKLIKIDMSEYMERWDVTKLIGASPGYVGYENGGQLTNAVKENPQSVICFDEIEKANHAIFDVLLQVMEDGVLTSNAGEKINFKETLIIMTSNIGAEHISGNKRQIGFTSNDDNGSYIESNIKDSLKKTFKPEFLNRLDDIIVFNALTEKHISQICKIMLRKVKSRAQSLSIKVSFDKTATAELIRRGFSNEYGARPLRREISACVEDLLADMVLTGDLNSGDDVRVAYDEKNGFTTVKKYSE